MGKRSRRIKVEADPVGWEDGGAQRNTLRTHRRSKRVQEAAAAKCAKTTKEPVANASDSEEAGARRKEKKKKRKLSSGSVQATKKVKVKDETVERSVLVMTLNEDVYTSEFADKVSDRIEHYREYEKERRTKRLKRVLDYIDVKSVSKEVSKENDCDLAEHVVQTASVVLAVRENIDEEGVDEPKSRSTTPILEQKTDQKPKKQRKPRPAISKYFKPTKATKNTKSLSTSEEKYNIPRVPGQSNAPFPPLCFPNFGLIQEEFVDDPFYHLIATIFLNKTTSGTALPRFRALHELFPTANDLAKVPKEWLVEFMRPLGLYNVRAERMLSLSRAWLAFPPTPGKCFRARGGYPPHLKGVERERKPVGEDEERDYEIAHLPGVGAYALDSWRIFCRDRFLNREEQEWKKVRPGDKELRAYLRWKWKKEGFDWDAETGKLEAINTVE